MWIVGIKHYNVAFYRRIYMVLSAGDIRTVKAFNFDSFFRNCVYSIRPIMDSRPSAFSLYTACEKVPTELVDHIGDIIVLSAVHRYVRMESAAPTSISDYTNIITSKAGFLRKAHTLSGKQVT